MSSTEIQGPSTADSLRQAARRFATGVTIVAVRYGRGAHALTANSFVTLSLDPALIGIAVTREGRMRRLTEQVRRFGVSVLHDGQEEYARHYASRDRASTPAHLELPAADAKAPPLVPGCVAYFDCELRQIHPVGDHDLIIGAVLDCGVRSTARGPLVFLDGKYQDTASWELVRPQ